MVQGTVRKKDSINATVSPSLKKKVVELVESGEYSSMSDVVTQALTINKAECPCLQTWDECRQYP